MITSKTHANNLFTGINSPYIPYPIYISNFQEVGRSFGINTNKYPELRSIYYYQIAVRLAQKKQQFVAADNSFVDFKTVVVKKLSRTQNNKNKTCSYDITNQTERSSLVNYSDDELTELIESGQLVFIVQNGRKIYLNSLD